MKDDNNSPRHPRSADSGDVDNQINDVLPVPSSEHEGEAGHVDGPMDTSLPTPGDESHAADDATTREELGVDTTADDIDDFIDPSPERTVAESNAEPEAPDIGDEPETWQHVGHSPEEPTAPDPDVEPINHDSDFFASGYQSGPPHTERTTGSRAQSAGDAERAHQCNACGASIGNSPYCPQCGTNQDPESGISTVVTSLLAWSRPLAVRGVLSAAVILAVIALLANSGASALVISAMAIPIVLVVRLYMQLQAHSSIGWMPIGIMALVGMVTGLPLAWFAARIVRRSWIENGVFNFGAAGFGGVFAEGAGVAPFIVWLVVGLLLPVVIMLGLGAIPAALRMVMNCAPRESTGMLLSGAVASGYTVASGVMFYRPLYSEFAPSMTSSQWTLTIFGLAVIRPLVWIFAGTMIGAVVWRYIRTASPASIMLPAAIAGAIPLGFSLGSLAVAPVGYWPETILGLIFATLTVFLYHRFLPIALRNDATISANGGTG